ncbi:monooxygenase [Paeniglutamicibacter cryotolerans]|uniref:Alkylation response protein AidB-like acyl-CoA dehydrogenase n=1 Tax=Paeniglutamicibacter cryotolerans TaxID=670079 RepID=A0A839QI49_9MICC|nr:monooxygenase [Paeniglutamicibacter cryotolerans]MBB2995849.1 alkylation response protein AidB-like acyl-CoA dehydrogenase [Paeniglutamicibacter cryotolerans]
MSSHLQEAPAVLPFSGLTQPANAAAWLDRAREVAAVLAIDAVARDRAGVLPTAEVQLLKDSRLTVLLGPAEHGGGAQRWETAFQVIRIVSAADGSIGQLLGYHLFWAWAARLIGTDAQIAAVEQLYTSQNLFFGAAVNPRDNDLVAQDLGAELLFNGRKSFTTGASVSDLLVLEGALKGSEVHVFAIVPTAQEGITFTDDWDNLGQRLSASGGALISGVRADWSSAAGFIDKEYQPLVYNTLNVPLIQQVFSSIYLGIAEGALAAALEYTGTRTRPWPYTSDPKESASEEFHVLEGYGKLRSALWAASALADAVDAELAAVLHAPRAELTASGRGEIAVRVAAAKQVAADTALETTARIFEFTGARATANNVGLDIYWRNVRTHSLHDPVAYKRREVGQYALLGLLPTPSWYT